MLPLFPFQEKKVRTVSPLVIVILIFNIHTFHSQFFSETIILVQLLFSHYSFNFSGIHVSISPAGSAVIGPQIAQYILLRPATKMKSSLLTSPFTLHLSEIDFPTDYKTEFCTTSFPKAYQITINLQEQNCIQEEL